MAKPIRRYLIFLILALGLALRLVNLSQSFWLDEATQGQLSALSLSQIWFGRGGDFHPPLYYLFSHYWLLVSHSEVWLRFPSIIFSLVNIYILYLFAKLLFKTSVWAPYLAAFLLAIAPFSIYYSQEFRSYSLLCLLGTLSMYFFYRRRYFTVAFVNTLAVYTHYAAVFFIVTQFVIWFIYFRDRHRQFFLSQLILVILYLPWLPQFLRQLHSGISIKNYFPGWYQVLSVAPLKAFPVVLFKIAAGRIDFLNRYLYGLYIVSVFAIVFSGLLFAPKFRYFLLSWLFLPVFLLIIISLALPQTQPFRVIFILPALVLLLTQACLRFPRLFITLLLYIALVGNITYFTRPRLQREQWRQAISYLQSRAAPTTLVAVKFTAKFSPFYWYDPSLPVAPLVSAYPAGSADLAAHLSALPPSVRSLYVLDYLGDLTDPRHLTAPALTAAGFSEVSAQDFSGVGIIRLYER